MKKVIVCFLIALVAGFYILNSEAFQKAVFPKKYWTEKVSELESAMQYEEGEIRDLLIELEKIERTKDLEIAKK